ncbi:neutral trehalase [Lophiotrema nucula]|uniref:Trehalase n=1 Tax=Lophiotrema nucula TaxID=690887 RepID=A0A6A5YK32_9PLEO|nr:neutral trehalase [Lophiotrema nucula]
MAIGTDGGACCKEESRTHRRGSHDLTAVAQEGFLVEVDSTLHTLLHREDVDGDGQITIDDVGHKIIYLRTSSSRGFRTSDVRGTYMLSNLLQELVVAKENELKSVSIPQEILEENPVHRLQRLIKDRFWANLERRLDEAAIGVAATDDKDYTEDPRPRIYVPQDVPEQYAYYKNVAGRRPELQLDVQLIPRDLNDDEYREIIKKPGILALDMEETTDPTTGRTQLRGLPFIVPGGCFNELYNWDSYFIALGLLVDDKVDTVKALVKNFIFEIQHYGLIPNANRSYYLLRSQPPFLTDLARRTSEKMEDPAEARELLQQATLAAIKEYYKVWMSSPRYDDATGLSRYRPAGVASPPECTTEHFAGILEPYATSRGMSVENFRKAYDAGKIVDEPVLDEYFLHDRGVRESGHDISMRVEHVCADLATIDLNCLLYKYEVDIGWAIGTVFADPVFIPVPFRAPRHGVDPYETAEVWFQRAAQRKQAIDRYLWNEEQGMYLDYNTKTKTQTTFETATSFWALWCGVASPRQAEMIVAKALPKFERLGGLVSTTRDLKGLQACHEAHQWGFPYGWAPHQVMAWDGLRQYGYVKEAERLTYKWLQMITKVFVDFNGTVVEKYDVTQTLDPHKVNLDYGNQGLGFKGYAKEGFGWTNASYVYGLQFLSGRAKRALGVCAPWSVYSHATPRGG